MDILSFVAAHGLQWGAIILLMIGLYIVMTRGNLIKKMVGLNIFQTAVFLLYVSVAWVRDGTAPIVHEHAANYSNPLPHVLILTAIVVAVANMSVALALIVRIHESYGSIEEDEMVIADQN